MPDAPPVTMTGEEGEDEAGSDMRNSVQYERGKSELDA
jgi:hypothetical protein